MNIVCDLSNKLSESTTSYVSLAWWLWTAGMGGWGRLGAALYHRDAQTKALAAAALGLLTFLLVLELQSDRGMLLD